MNIIYPQGTATVTVPATESIAVYTLDKAQVFQRVGFPNQPASLDELTEVNGAQVVYGAYSAGATIVINANAAPVFYAVGVAPQVPSVVQQAVQPSPTAVNTTGAVSAAAILGRIVTSSTAAAVAGTIPTGTVMDAASEFDVDDAVSWSVINTGPNTFTVTAATDHTIVGAGAVATATSGRFLTRKTAANVFVTYRLS